MKKLISNNIKQRTQSGLIPFHKQKSDFNYFETGLSQFEVLNHSLLFQ